MKRTQSGGAYPGDGYQSSNDKGIVKAETLPLDSARPKS
jgi:hypothetical protein